MEDKHANKEIMFLNTVIALIFQVVTIVSGLIVPRLILQTYGSEYNGVVSSVTQFLGVVSFLTVGLTGAARVELYKSLATNDNEATSRIMGATNRYMQKVAIVLAIYAMALAMVYPFISHTVISPLMIGVIVFVIGLGRFFEYFLGMPCRILLQAAQKNFCLAVHRKC